MADHGSRQFRHQFLLRIFRVSELAAHLTVETFSRHGRVSHFVQHGRIILHTATIDFLRSIADIELLLQRNDNPVCGRRIESPIHTLVRLYRTEPPLGLYHTVKSGMGIHTPGISKLRNFELFQQLLHTFRLNLCQIGLIHIIDRESLDKRYRFQIFPFLTAHGTVFVRTDFPPVLVLYQHVPIDYGKRLFAFQHVSFEIMRLLEGQIDR